MCAANQSNQELANVSESLKSKVDNVSICLQFGDKCSKLIRKIHNTFLSVHFNMENLLDEEEGI